MRLSGVFLLLLLVPWPVEGVLSDPTRPPFSSEDRKQSAASRPSGWHLSSILISPERRVAIVNGQAVQPGEFVGGALLVEILPTEVRLRKSSREFIVRLPAAAIKATAESAGEGKNP